ncbi:hypothetical protein DL769_001914 [Monosporascus sp. CRB-8-3]|nr:hypothetical protein DL769_001914 [Monosporascus sp. CRB-8-3]
MVDDDSATYTDQVPGVERIQLQNASTLADRIFLFKHVLLAKMSDYLQYFDFDAYMADTQVEPFDFGSLDYQPSTTHGSYHPSPSDLPDANAATMDS